MDKEELKRQLLQLKASGGTKEQARQLVRSSMQMNEDARRWAEQQGTESEGATVGGATGGADDYFIRTQPGVPLRPMEQWETGLAELPEGKAERFRVSSGGGEAMQRPGTDEMYYRYPEEGAWRSGNDVYEKPLLQNLFGPDPVDWGDAMGGIRSESRDIPRIVGAGVGAVAMNANPWLKGAKIASEATGAFLGYLGGGAAEEALESYQGLQDQDLAEVAMREGKEALIEGAIDYGAGKVLQYGAPFFSNKYSRQELDPSKKKEAADIVALQDLEVDMPSLKGFQTPGTTDTMMGTLTQQVARQTDRGTGALSKEIERQGRAVTEILESMRGRDITDTGKKLVEELEPRYLQNQEDIYGFDYTPEKGGFGVKNMLDSWKDRRISRNNRNYKDVDDIAAIEDPVFDLTPVQQRLHINRANDPKYEKDVAVDTGFVDARGNPITTVITQQLPVLEPPARLRAIRNILTDMNPQQPDYRVLKTLRTELGNIRNQVKMDNNGLVPQEYQGIKGLYDDLTDALETPLNAGNTPGYIEAYARANRDARDFYKRNEETEMQAIFNNTSPSKIINGNISNAALFSPAVRKTMREMQSERPDAYEAYQEAMSVRLFESPDAVQAVNNLSSKNFEVYEMLGGDRLAETAAKVQELRNTVAGRTLQNKSRPSEVYKTLVQDINKPADAIRLLEDLGGSGSYGHDLAQLAVVESFLDKALAKTTTYGEPILGAKKVTALINDYKDRGVWRLLNRDNQTRLEGAAAFLRSAESPLEGSDLGASLETQQLVSQLKSPVTFLKGLSTVVTNKGLAIVLMNSNGDKKLRRIMEADGPLTNKITALIDSVIAPSLAQWAHKEEQFAYDMEQEY